MNIPNRADIERFLNDYGVALLMHPNAETRAAFERARLELFAEAQR